jgi:hypothetical protein
MAGRHVLSSRQRFLVTQPSFLRAKWPMGIFGRSKPAGPLSQDMLSLGGCFLFGARIS